MLSQVYIAGCMCEREQSCEGVEPLREDEQ